MGTYHKNDGFYHYNDFTNVHIKIKQAEILIPNLFTPEYCAVGQGFEIKGLANLADHNLYIVNRWGQEVYKAHKYNNDWTAEGLKEGNYYYLLMIKESVESEWKSFKGYVTLLRIKKYSTL